jgi:cytochrome c
MDHFGKAAACCIALVVATSAAFGGDVERGKRLAQLRCAACHIIGPGPRAEVADAPPFEVIGRKWSFNADALVFALVGPHRKMNFGLTRPDADDVAAYIASLAK